MTEGARRVLGIPEMRYAICSWISRHEASRMVLVSRAFFHPAIARIWGDGFVTAENLMAILPELEISKRSGNYNPLRNVCSCHCCAFRLAECRQAYLDRLWRNTSKGSACMAGT